MAPVEEVAVEAAEVEAERNSLNQGSLIGYLVPHPFSHGAFYETQDHKACLQ
jgi:hypothetical protein